ncbi:hypothetical protein ACFOX0_16100 [Micromonospora zhanjiangensis]|uniref:Adhesin domain-containing protein n=1 Tax=Micromonospora zhanjiangensis TaxID=1522057 RepID=A0ABV8KMU5_9ACTN
MKSEPPIVKVFESQPGQVRRVNIDIVGGNIRLNASRRDTVAVRAKGDTATLGAKAHVAGDVLHIGSSSAWRYFRQRGRIDLILDLPNDMDVDIKVFGADVVVDGGTGRLHVKSVALSIEGTTYSRDVQVKFRVGSNDLATPNC